MNALTFQIHLLDPVLVTQLGGGDPNSAVGFDYIPGSVIRGALIGKHLKGADGDATDNDFRRLFFDGGVRFLNAFPLSYTGQRTLPTPFSWHSEKDEIKPVYDFALKKDDSDKTWKIVNDPFCYIWEDENGKHKTELYNPDRQIKIHTYRDDRQRVTEGNSNIFRYQALDSGQNFGGVILIDDPLDIYTIKALLCESTILSFGKSHLAGYGRVRIESVKHESDWKEYNPANDILENEIIVTLLSDAIVRDSKTGGYVASINPILNNSNSKAAFVRTRVIGGFNRKWNLPLPQTQAIQAGSVFVYKNEPGLRNYLKTLEASGIGEKREEGFGRIAVDWNLDDEIKIKDQAAPAPKIVELEGESVAFAQKIVNRMLRVKLDQALLKKINDLSIERKGIHKAQLSRMRVMIRTALNENKADAIINYIGSMKSTAKNQLQSARIEGETLEEWIKSSVNDPQRIWVEINVNSVNNPSLGGIKPELTEIMALEYTLRLINGILHKTLKEAKNE